MEGTSVLQTKNPFTTYLRPVHYDAIQAIYSLKDYFSWIYHPDL